jgi:hypothetical protein
LIKKENIKKFQTKLNQKNFIKEKYKKKTIDGKKKGKQKQKKKRKSQVYHCVHSDTFHCAHKKQKQQKHKKKKNKLAATVNIPRVLEYSIIQEKYNIY